MSTEAKQHQANMEFQKNATAIPLELHVSTGFKKSKGSGSHISVTIKFLKQV